jgi:hypothetical protein
LYHGSGLEIAYQEDYRNNQESAKNRASGQKPVEVWTHPVTPNRQLNSEIILDLQIDPRPGVTNHL